MENLNKISNLVWNEFVYGGHIISLSDVCTFYAFAIILNIKVTWSFLVVIYLSVFAINTFNRYKELEQDFLTNPERAERTQKYIKFFPFLIYSSLFIVLGLVFYFASVKALLFTLPLFLLGLIYTLFLKGFTKKIIGFKNFAIAIPYSLLVIFFALYYLIPISLSIFLIFIFYYIRVFMSAMFFDIKDIESDKKEGLKTFAVVLGQKKTIQVLRLINVLSALPVVYGVYLKLFPNFSLGVLLTIPYAFFYYWKVERKKINKAFLYNVIADGEFVLWLPFVLLGKVLLS